MNPQPGRNAAFWGSTSQVSRCIPWSALEPFLNLYMHGRRLAQSVQALALQRCWDTILDTKQDLDNRPTLVRWPGPVRN